MSEELAYSNYRMRFLYGNANPTLAMAIGAQKVITDVAARQAERAEGIVSADDKGIFVKSKVSKFKDGEVSVQIERPVRGADVFIIQPTCKGKDGDVNDSLMELLVMIDAVRRASARRITAVIPYFGYARQDRKSRSRDPITAKLVANMITAAGANRVLTLDLHADQIQGFFDIPLDNMQAERLLSNHYKKMFAEHLDENKKLDPSKFVVVSPDVGSIKRARSFAGRLGADLAIVDKRREVANVSEVMNIIGKVEGKVAILIDDMVDTGGSLCNAAKAVADKGATEVYACATHALLSGDAVAKIQDSVLKQVVFTDTIPYPKDQSPCDKIIYESVAPMFASAIDHIHKEHSIAEIYV